MLRLQKLKKYKSLFKKLTVALLEVHKNSNFSTISNNRSIFNSSNCASNKSEVRYNEINLQMLPRKLYEQIFGSTENDKKCHSNDILLIKEELAKYGLGSECTPESPSVDISLPPLQGCSIEEHFENIALEQVEPYKTVINKLLDKKLPPLPKKFILKEGWTHYTESGPEPVEFPLENGLVLDVEVCMKNGPLPVLATAVSTNSWYSWVSKQLIEETHSPNFMKKPLKSNLLIPLESLSTDSGFNLNKFQSTPKIIVGHSISFDRIRIKEQYWLKKSATRFLDTMALHVSVSGTSSYQRLILKSKNSEQENDYLHSISSLNNLADVYKLYCGETLDKTKRDIFIDGNLRDIKEKFNESMLYCALDVVATYKVLKKVYPLFEKRFPHPATLAGMLELGLAYLPVNRNWKRYLDEAETTYNDLNLESKICLSRKADQACRLLIDDKYKTDPWMWDEDWSTKDLQLKKGYDKISNNSSKILKDQKENSDVKLSGNLQTKFKYIEKTKVYLPKKMSQMAGYPNWYRKLCLKLEKGTNTFPKVQNISTSMQVTPKLLNLRWENYPLHYIKEQGWGFLVPYTKNDNTKLPLEQILVLSRFNSPSSSSIMRSSSLAELKSNYLLNANLDECCYFFKLPHKNGTQFNVGNPLAKDFLNKFSENIIAGVDASATRILTISKMCSYWKNNRDRILSQLVVWLNVSSNNAKQENYRRKDKDVILNSENGHKLDFGAIIPQVVVAGTLTRRAVEPTWMTASNANSERIGSELRAMINAPPDYSIVGADVDSQELWIASVIGDAFTARAKVHGATPFSWMTLIGNKAQGTDMHSMTAKAIGINRDQAKVINYARIYGAGRLFAERLLKQFNPTMSDKEAALKAKKMFSMTKGQKLYGLAALNEETCSKVLLSQRQQQQRDFYSAHESFRIARLLNKPRDALFKKAKWIGGSESAMFNSLEEIAGQAKPATPFLRSRLSRALEKDHDNKNLPTKINWVVQSSAVDFLHLVLVCMRWLMKDKASLCLTFHDEVRYLVPSKYKYNAALAMHVTNLLVRSFFVSRLNMTDLPMSVAFFTAVEVDSVLRKEASQDCTTPSNPHGLEEGYGILHGESLNVWAAVDKSKGCIGMFPPTSKLKHPKHERRSA